MRFFIILYIITVSIKSNAQHWPAVRNSAPCFILAKCNDNCKQDNKLQGLTAGQGLRRSKIPNVAYFRIFKNYSSETEEELAGGQLLKQDEFGQICLESSDFNNLEELTFIGYNTHGTPLIVGKTRHFENTSSTIRYPVVVFSDLPLAKIPVEWLTPEQLYDFGPTQWVEIEYKINEEQVENIIGKEADFKNIILITPEGIYLQEDDDGLGFSIKAAVESSFSLQFVHEDGSIYRAENQLTIISDHVSIIDPFLIVDNRRGRHPIAGQRFTFVTVYAELSILNSQKDLVFSDKQVVHEDDFNFSFLLPFLNNGRYEAIITLHPLTPTNSRLYGDPPTDRVEFEVINSSELTQRLTNQLAQLSTSSLNFSLVTDPVDFAFDRIVHHYDERQEELIFTNNSFTLELTEVAEEGRFEGQLIEEQDTSSVFYNYVHNSSYAANEEIASYSGAATLVPDHSGDDITLMEYDYATPSDGLPSGAVQASNVYAFTSANFTGGELSIYYRSSISPVAQQDLSLYRWSAAFGQWQGLAGISVGNGIVTATITNEGTYAVFGAAPPTSPTLTASVTAPADGDSFDVPQLVPVTVEVVGTGTVDSVELYLEDQRVGAMAGAGPYTYSLDLPDLGSYELQVIAWNGVEAATSESIYVHVVGAPTIAWVSPEDLSVIDASVQMELETLGTGNVQEVEFYYVPLGEQFSLHPDLFVPPVANDFMLISTVESLGRRYVTSWTTPSPQGYALVVKAVGETMTSSDTLYITSFADEAPYAELISPSTADTIFTSVEVIPLAASAIDSYGTIDSVRFFSGNTYLGTQETMSQSDMYEFNWFSPDVGLHDIYGVAYDSTGNYTHTDTLTIAVLQYKAKPVINSVTITGEQVVDGEVNVEGLATHILFVSASDTDGVIDSVVFHLNGVHQATLTGSTPYNYTWDVSEDGTYYWAIEAFDDDQQSTEQQIRVFISDTSAPPAPTNLVATLLPTMDSISLSWNESVALVDGQPIQALGYSIIQDGVGVNLVFDIEYKFAGFVQEVDYTFGVAAFNAEGNRSDTTEVLFQWPACPAIIIIDGIPTSDYIKAANSITATNFTLSTGDNLSLQSAGSLTLSPGFSAEEGSLLEAYIANCSASGPSNARQFSAFGSSENQIMAQNQEAEATDSFTIYPNPAEDKFTVFWNSQITAQRLRIITAKGNVVYNAPWLKGIKALELNVANLNDGLYLVQVETSSGVHVKRIVLK